VTVDPRRLRRSPLSHRRADLAGAGGRAVAFAELPFLSLVNLRVDPASAAAGRVETALAVDLPPAGRVALSPHGGSLLRLGPDELLVVADHEEPAALVSRLTAAVGADPGSIVDVSASRATLLLAGPRARDVLQKGCTLDLHPRSFPVGRCAQTTFARDHALVWAATGADQGLGRAGGAAGDGPGDPVYLLLFRASFADYFADWLVDAAAEYRQEQAGDS
jgi:sarcosine oxidase, subunit gamma